eukprot:TRINITY_DN55_c0_g2_i2.p1 TRINITY_DN55_c0_g2~~TRINITY_DN55_c0_g2_i2.p1  ORF type:complete len:1324 (-),score=392.29 TRINITY_DN55_c0_g2_i2:43-4014(-)
MKVSRAQQLLLCSSAVLLWIASATHFRYGLITYDQVNPSSSGVDFNIYNQQAWRWSAYGNPIVNQTLYLDATLYFSSNQGLGVPGGFNPLFTVNAYNQPNDWFIAVTGANRVSFSAVTSTTVGSTFMISASSCCRISSLLNNHDGSWRSTSLVYVLKNANFKSIKASVVPITTLIVNKQSTFSVNFITYNNEKLSYRLATAYEASGYSSSAYWVPPTGLSVDWQSGAISWKPTVTGLYTVQIVIQGNSNTPTSATDVSSLQSYVSLDWILQVIDTTSLYCKRFCGNAGSFCSSSSNCWSCDETKTARTPKTPYCDPNTPPYFTNVRWNLNNKAVTRDVDNSVAITAIYSSQLVVYIDTMDDDIEDYISVGTAAIPAGVGISQVKYEGSTTATLTWTPGDNDLGGAVICFTATDSLGFNTVGQLCLVITVGQGALSASGTGLTYAIAGAITNFLVFNSASRTHSLTFQGVGNTYTGTVVDMGTTTVTTQGTQEVYQANYNLTGSGLYVLTVADTTSTLAIKPKSVVSILTVDPNVTAPASCTLFEQGSTGLTGGLVNSQVSFYLRAFDAFGNAQSLQRTDMFYFTLSYYASNGTYVTSTTNMLWNPSSASGTTDYRYNGTYKIPALAANNYTYTLNVYYKSSSTASAVLIKTKSPTVISTGFSCSFSFGSFVAGKAVSFTFSTSGLTTTEASTKAFTASMNGVPATVTYGSGTTFTFTAPAETFTLAGNYPKGIVLSAAGLGASSGSTSTGTGTIYVDFDVINDVPTATYSTVTAKDSQNIYSLNVNELSASEDPATIVIQLRDKYNNPCSVGDFSVGFSTVNSAGATNTGTATQSTVRQLFYFYYTPNVAGAFSITSTVYITADSSSFNLQVISGRIVPGVFSNSKSSYSPVSSSDRDTVAGIFKTFLVIARDYLGNVRNEDPDLFNGTITRAKFGTIPALTTVIPYQPFKVPEQYQFSYGSNVSGSYSLQINVAVTSIDPATGAKSSAYVNFATLPFTMWAGKLYQSKITAVDADNVKYNTRAEIVIQSQDIYNNTIEDLTGGRYIDPTDSTSTVQTYSNVTQAYIVEVSSTNKMIWTLYMAGYCPRTGTKPSKCPTSYLESSTDEKEDEDEDSDDSFAGGVKYKSLSATDQTLYSQGFFRVFYRVPRALFYTNYTVNVYLLNTQKSGNSSSWRARVNDSSTVLVKSFVFNVVPSNEADNQTQTLSVAVVIGAAAGCFFVSGVGYGAFRLSRYRPKYKEAKKEADENEQILEEMRDEGNIAGGRDYMAVGGAVVTMNPLHETYQVEHQQRAGFVQAQNPALKAGEHEAFGEDVEAPLRPSGM